MLISRIELFRLIFISIFYPSEADSESMNYVVSAESLRLLARQEQVIIKSLDQHSKYLQGKIIGLQRLLQDYMAKSENITKVTVCDCEPLREQKPWGYNSCGNETAGSILAAKYLIGKNLEFQQWVADLEVLAQSSSSQDEDLLSIISNVTDTFPTPSGADRLESVNSLLTLIGTYNLDEEDLAKGKIMDRETHSGLSMSNLLELGNRALRYKMYKQAVNFFDQGLLMSRSSNDNEFGQLATEMFSKKLRSTVKIHDENFGNKSLLWSNFFSEPLVGADHSAFARRKKQTMPIVPLNPNEFHQPEMFRNFDRLCQLGYSQPLLEKHESLTCVLYSGIHPYWILAPMKIEILHKDPFIIQIYNVISEYKANMIISSAKLSLRRSEVLVDPDAANKGDPSVTFFRSSVNAWLDDATPGNSFSFLNEIVQRLTGFVNLQVRYQRIGSETIQVANYATGGKYLPHIDAFYVDPDLTKLSHLEALAGDRLATFMLYLNDVALGGGTAFPTLGVVARPVAHSALFWFNLHYSGSIDPRTVHGGCPVLYGNKWVANKWVRANEQMFTFKCAANGSKYKPQQFYKTYFKL